MLEVTTVSTPAELSQINALNRQNLKQHLSPGEREKQGFVTWLYSLELLEQMHGLAPSIIVKDGDNVVGYALTTLQASRVFHPDLDQMFHQLEPVLFRDRPLFSYAFYCMGQICVAGPYRGRGLVSRMYQKHRAVYGGQFDFILTEISTQNLPSLKAHEKMGFQTIYTHVDAMDTWKVVVWDWL
ncbi:MAG: N-acetyltransferase family protein [Flavisolibacter sp.]